MTTVHFIMQGKGGVGKSFVSSILMQYLIKQGLEVFGCDTDLVNSTLVRYESLDVKMIDIMSDADIDPGCFDLLINHIAGSRPDAHVVVDIGSSGYASMGHLLKKYDAFSVLQAQNHTVYIHTIIVGGVSRVDSLGTLQTLADNFSAPIVVWLNPFFGDVIAGDEKFEDFKVCQEVKESLHGIIRMPYFKPCLFGRDIADMQTRHLTFEEAVGHPDFGRMPRHRLETVWKQYQEAISQVSLF